jgi:hypothetical protein
LQAQLEPLEHKAQRDQLVLQAQLEPQDH